MQSIITGGSAPTAPAGDPADASISTRVRLLVARILDAHRLAWAIPSPERSVSGFVPSVTAWERLHGVGVATGSTCEVSVLQRSA